MTNEKVVTVRQDDKRGLGSEHGQAMVEFALVVAPLLVILLGVLDFGKGLNYWIDQTQLAAEGARLAAVSGGNTLPAPPGPCLDGSSPGGDLAAYIQCQADTSELRNGTLDPATGKIATDPQVPAPVKVCITPLPNSITGTTGAVGDPIQVTVTSEYRFLGFLAGNLPQPAITLTGSATMRLERTWEGGPTCP